MAEACRVAQAAPTAERPNEEGQNGPYMGYLTPTRAPVRLTYLRGRDHARAFVRNPHVPREEIR